MTDEVAEWKARQRVAMAQQLQLEEESLARLEAAAAANEADATKGSVHGGMFGGSEVDESAFDAPNMVKVRQLALICVRLYCTGNFPRGYPHCRHSLLVTHWQCSECCRLYALRVARLPSTPNQRRPAPAYPA